MRRYREEEPLLNKDKMKTMAFSNLIGSIIFLAIGIWAWFQTGNFPEVANTYVQASTFPRVMIVGVVIFSLFSKKGQARTACPSKYAERQIRGRQRP